MRGVVQCRARGSMGARQKAYRLYSCGRCAEQVRICCDCDRGNRYCAGACAQIRRRESLLRAGERYQLSYHGACGHAVRQRAWRARQAQKVTHQGSLPSAVPVIVVTTSTQTIQGIHVDIASIQPSARRCSFCWRALPPFARLGALRGGP